MSINKAALFVSVFVLILISSLFSIYKYQTSYWYVLNQKVNPIKIKLEDSEVMTICKWVSDNIPYKSDVIDYWQAPEETLKLHTGDCEDHAILTASLLKAHGYKVVVRTGYYFFNNGEDAYHAWVVLDKKYIIDTTSNKMIIGIENCNYIEKNYCINRRVR